MSRPSGPRRSGKAPSQRQLRVGEELRHALAHVLERADFRDPALAARPVTITEIRVSPDLRNATVFVTPLGGGGMGEVLAGLKRVRPYLRHQIAGMVELRCVPDLRFEADVSFERAGRIEQLLRSPDVRRDVAEKDAGEKDGEEKDGDEA